MVLADTLCRIKNGYMKHKLDVVVINSNFMRAILLLAWNLGYISSFSIIDNTQLKVFLKYVQGDSGWRGYKLISVPGNRVYITHKKLLRYRKKNIIQKAGFLIISTNKGLMTDQEALKQNLGGEVLFYIY